jgi:hypothetical protein
MDRQQIHAVQSLLFTHYGSARDGASKLLEGSAKIVDMTSPTETMASYCDAGIIDSRDAARFKVPENQKATTLM